MEYERLRRRFCYLDDGIVEASDSRDAAAMMMGECLLTNSILSLFIVDVSSSPPQT